MKIASAKFWFKFFGVLALTCLLPLACLLPLVTAPDGEKTLARVPIGSKLADLDQLLVRGFDGLSDVYEWLPASEHPDSTEEQFSNEFGTFIWKELGSYKEWEAPDEERNRFTGEITLLYFSIVIPDDLNPSFQITYYYVNGSLVKKQLIHLAG